jgi:hypothetical protein
MVDRRPYIAEASTGNATEKESCRSRGIEQKVRGGNKKFTLGTNLPYVVWKIPYVDIFFSVNLGLSVSFSI